jgi:DNA-binding NarL/FixJ family response regulator
MSIGILVVDDNELLRAGLVTVLRSDPDLTVVAEAGNGIDAVALAEQHRPDVVLMDVEMPGGDGITATRRILASTPGTRVLILTMFDLDDYVVEGLRAGASGFLLKTTEPRPLIQAVKSCAAGQTTIGEAVMGRLVDSYLVRPEPPPRHPGLDELTPRELDVLRELSRGLSNAEIARTLFLGETTVKTHVARILVKLGVRDRIQAAVVVHRSGLPLD